MAAAADSKSAALKACGFESHLRHPGGCMMRMLTQLVALILAATCAAGSPRLAGYLPYWAADTLETKRLVGLTDLILFSAQPREDGSLDTSDLARTPWEKIAVLRAGGTRIHLCLGGWGRSGHFAAVTADPARRARLVAAITRFCEERKLDGVDLDWEHPRGATELGHYGMLVDELRLALSPRKGEVTVTLAEASQLPPNIGRRADRVQLMAYDMPGRQSTTEAAIARAEAIMAAGVPPDRLMLGVPFYGRGVTERGRTLPYREILTKYHPGPAQDDVDGLHCNGPITMTNKAAWVRQRGLAGIMIWEVSQDADGATSLLGALRAGLDPAR